MTNFGAMFLVPVILVLLFLYLFRLKTPGLSGADLPLAYVLKLCGNFFFIVVYTYYYGWGDLTADPAVFIRESKMVTALWEDSPLTFFRFVFGPNDPYLAEEFLPKTYHWNAADLTLLNDSRNVLRVNALLNFLTGGNVWQNSLFFSFFSLLGFRELYLAFRKRIRLDSRKLWFALILFPSTLFWTSGMLKEPLMMTGFCLVLAASFGKLSTAGKCWRLGLGLFLMIGFKPYVLVCLLPLLLTKWLFNPEKRTKSAAWLYVLIPAPLFALVMLLPSGEKVTKYLTRKQYDFINVGRGGLHAYADTCFFYFRPEQYSALRIESDGDVFLERPILAKRLETGKASPFHDIRLKPNTKPWTVYYMAEPSRSYIQIPQLLDEKSRLITTAPQAIANAAFRPFFGDQGGWLKYPAIIETLLLFTLLGWTIARAGKIQQDKLSIVVFLAVFAVTLLLLIGWITPVLGAIVRYRIPAYLSIFLISLLLYKKRVYR